MSDDLSPLEQFSGTVRLFPLPNLVLFPEVMQPLHIFEPRYRQMTRDALAGDRLLALVLLRPGWEADYNNRPALYSVVCVGHIVAEQSLDDGRYNLLLRGLSRARLTRETETGKPYRSAEVELLADLAVPLPAHEKDLRRRLVQLVPSWFPGKGPLLKQFRKLLKSDRPLGVLCDIVTFALPLSVEFKQELLEELNVEYRVRRLLAHLQEVERKFPPEFSPN